MWSRSGRPPTRSILPSVSTVSFSTVGGGLVQDDSRGGEESGLGDVVLRGKYNFHKGFAGAFDIRLPTGDEEELLGSGATQIKLLLIARGKKYDVFYGGLHPHLNIGYTYSTGDYDLDFDDPTVEKLKAQGYKMRFTSSITLPFIRSYAWAWA